MNTSKILLLASQSASRRTLLQEADIPFIIINQLANERDVNWQGPLEQLLKDIAVLKMNSIVLDDNFSKSDSVYVLTADTMGQSIQGVVDGKPLDKEDAIKKLKAMRNEGVCGTAFCLDKKSWNGSSWITQERVLECVLARYVFDIPEYAIEDYLNNVPYLMLSGACCINGYGAQFLKTIHGSYSTVQGLPMFELRQALHTIGFFKK